MTQPNFQYIAQEDEMACGLAALAMVIAHYGTSPALSRLRQLTQTNALGQQPMGYCQQRKRFILTRWLCKQVRRY
nr:cysteine peptidase family C39 domain-containing protein [Leuconostoc lactis]